MPRNVFSKVQPDVLLLSINKGEEINEQRTDICPSDEYLQISTKKVPQGMKFKPHRHNNLERTTDITQEAWIILKGSIMATFWDIDDTVLEKTKLQAGDCAVVYRAGHGFEVLEEGTILYEVKTGPYFGIEKDKTMIKTDKGV